MGPQLYRCGNRQDVRVAYDAAVYASMGPQLYRCGNGPVWPARSTARNCFNGAATLSLRKYCVVFYDSITMPMLQWGRNFIVAEIHGARATSLWSSPSFNGAATLIVAEMNQPPCHLVLFWSCFNGAATLSLRKLDQEPQAVRDLVALQWGRNFIVAEMSHRSANWPTGATLQWGRNFIVAEIRNIQHQRLRNSVASMGPQLYRCGNVTRASSGRRKTQSFNGAATLSLRKSEGNI